MKARFYIEKIEGYIFSKEDGDIWSWNIFLYFHKDMWPTIQQLSVSQHRADGSHLVSHMLKRKEYFSDVEH